MKNLKANFLIIIFFTISCFSYGQVKEQTFEEYQKSENQNFQNYAEQETKAYEQYVKEEKEGLEKLKKEIEDFWGTGEFKTSTKKEWVEYSDDKKARSDVDFEKGVAKVEIIVDAEEASNMQATSSKLKQQIEELIQTKGKTKDYSTNMEQSKPLSEEPVLINQIENDAGEKVNANNSQDFAEEVVKKNVTKEFITGADGKRRAKISVSLNLAPDYIKTRASKYAPLVKKYAMKYNLPEELVYAVIHTESYFNPKAKSGAPAYGLMQLVPTSGARDSYLFVYKMDKILPANYLYDPEKNIELGTAYLQLLMKRHFNQVGDNNTKMLCAVASYNTGAGNLSRAYTGRTNPSAALPKINGMSYEENYGFLRYNLPYDETKDYIKKVTQRMMMYQKWK